MEPGHGDTGLAESAAVGFELTQSGIVPEFAHGIFGPANTGNEDLAVAHRRIKRFHRLEIFRFSGLDVQFRKSLETAHHLIGLAVAEFAGRHTLEDRLENIVLFRPAA